MKNLNNKARTIALTCTISFALCGQMPDEKKPETVITTKQASSAASAASAANISSVSIGLTFDNPVDNKAAAQMPLICKQLAKQKNSKIENTKPSLLIQAVRKRFFNALDSLIREGGRQCLNLQDKHGNTALHYAVMLGSQFAVKKLESRGADSNITNNDGLTPLDIANTRAEFFQNNLFARIALYLEATEDTLFTKKLVNVNVSQQKELVGLHNHQVSGKNPTVSPAHKQTPVIPDNYREIERYLLHLQKDRGKLSCMIFYSGRWHCGDISYRDYRIPLSSFVAGRRINRKSEFALTHKYLLATVATVNHALLDPEVSKSFVWHDLLSLVNKYIGVTMGDAIWDCEQRWGQNTDTQDLLLELDEVIMGYTKEKSNCIVQ